MGVTPSPTVTVTSAPSIIATTGYPVVAVRFWIWGDTGALTHDVSAIATATAVTASKKSS